MSYFLAASLVHLRNEINSAHPNRDKSSDGWVGDTSHQARVSDHNPDYSAGGIVRAIDVDRDGIDPYQLVQIACRDPRVEYVIFERKIYQRNRNFVPLAYNGSNPHDKHVHISLRHTEAAAATGVWGYSGGGAAPAPSGGASFEQVVAGVIAGDYGNGDDRKHRVAAAGQNYEAVQAEVNRRLGGGAPAPAGPSFEQVVADVIAGQYGNGDDRARRVAATGHNYEAVRAEVNRRLGGGASAPAGPSFDQVVAGVIAGQYGNGDDRARRVAATGHNYEQVRAEVNRRLGGSSPAPSRKSNEQIAAEVRRGEWGNNPQRSQRLQAAGYNPSAIQAIVNGGGGGAGTVRLSISQLASQVIAGQWGNGAERQNRITAAGYDYNAVRAEVNRRV